MNTGDRELLEDLHALDHLFADESKWTQGYMALDDQGYVISALHENAVCWCLDGGAVKVANGVASLRYKLLCGALNAALPRGAPNYVIWQDRRIRKFQQVKSLIARAIAAEEGRVRQLEDARRRVRQLEDARIAENSERISTLIGTPFQHADDCGSLEGDECTCGAFAADNR